MTLTRLIVDLVRDYGSSMTAGQIRRELDVSASRARKAFADGLAQGLLVQDADGFGLGPKAQHEGPRSRPRGGRRLVPVKLHSERDCIKNLKAQLAAKDAR